MSRSVPTPHVQHQRCRVVTRATALSGSETKTILALKGEGLRKRADLLLQFTCLATIDLHQCNERFTSLLLANLIPHMSHLFSCAKNGTRPFSSEVTQLLRCSVSSAISRIVIKSDQIFKGFPQPGQVVGVAGSPGLFIVMDLDHTNRIAQVMERSGRHRLSKVPIESIRTFNRRLAQAIHRLLDAR